MPYEQKEDDTHKLFSRWRDSDRNQSESHNQESQHEQHDANYSQSRHKLRINQIIPVNRLRQYTAQRPFILFRINGIEP